MPERGGEAGEGACDCSQRQAHSRLFQVNAACAAASGRADFPDRVLYRNMGARESRGRPETERYGSRAMSSIDLPERRLRDALLQHARVVTALMLRDIKTRMGASYFGFLVGLLIPLAHIGIVLVAYILLGRRAPIGTDVALYLASAIVPFVVWSYTHQKMMQSLAQNRVLTSFPIVKFTDIVIARALVEALNATLIVCVVAAVMLATGRDLFVADPPATFYALLLAYTLGISTGFLFGIMAMLAPAFMILGFVFIPLYWVTSGVFFIPEALPEQARMALQLFPLSHIVDFGRTAFYPSYLSSYANLFYVHALIVVNILICLMLERFLRPVLTAR
jgi:capsular polysaccharide transport system permease protein